MLRSILIGLDGSAYSTSAMRLGIAWAQRFNALAAGLGIIDAPTICKPAAVPLGGAAFKDRRDAALLEDARRQVEQFLGQFSVQCAQAQVACKVLEDVGLPCEQILLEAQRFDLILLGQESHFQFETQDQADDTLFQVLKNSPRPVVTVPRQFPPGNAVLVAYDGSLQAARTLQAFAQLGLAELGEVHVVCIHADHAEAERRAGRAAEYLRFQEVGAQVHALASSASAGPVLLEQAQKHQAGLLVMGAYGQSTLREFFLGSVTKTLVKEATLPLFLYH